MSVCSKGILPILLASAVLATDASAQRVAGVVRIGFRPRVIPFAGGAASDTALDIVLAALPTLLEAVNVNDQPQCKRRSDRAAAFSLWEQARAGLLATVVARESRPSAITVITYDRTLDRRGRIVRQQVRHDSLPTNHCFSLREDKDKHPGQIGLAFEPMHDRPGVVDVDGVLWVDVATPALRTLEFRYTNVERVIADAQIGGFMSFRTATNGLSVIDRWNLHLPSVQLTAEPRQVAEGPSARSSAPRCSGVCVPGAAQNSGRVLEVHDIGAQIATATWPDGSEWHAVLGTLRGRALRPDTTSAVRGALVWLVGSDDATRTAADGSFELAQLLPGPYPLFAAESPADRLVFQQNDSLRIEIDSAAMPPLRLIVPTVDDRIALFCRGVVAGPGRILMLAHVFLPDGSKASGASIEALCAQSASDPGHGYRERARTDTSGTFHVCGLRGGDTVQVTATLDSLDAQVRGGFRAYEDLTLFVVPLRLVVPPFRSRIMRVVDDQGNPIRGAWLLDEDTGEARATTNANGEASIGWMPRGRTGVRVERAGYEATTTTVMIAPDDESVVTVRLKRTP